jgi:hypothetical protein
MKDFRDARKNLWGLKKTASGMALDGTHYSFLHECLRASNCVLLDLLGCKSAKDYSAIFTRMNEFSHVGEFWDDENPQLADIAAYGLIMFERIMQAEADKASYEDYFLLHEQLSESSFFVLERLRLKITSRAAARVKLASDPKQKDKEQVFECWKAWQKTPLDHEGKKKYKGKEAFAKDMLKFESLESTQVITRWCRGWAKKHVTQPAE